MNELIKGREVERKGKKRKKVLPASVTLEKIREIAAANRPKMTLLSIVLLALNHLASAPGLYAACAALSAACAESVTYVIRKDY